MATSTSPLVWDFYRKVEDTSASNLGGVIHFYDEMSQSLWLPVSGGIMTNIADIEDGHWKNAEVQNTIDIATPDYTSLALDHAYNGVLFGVATLGNELVYLRYVYAMDCSHIIDSGSLNYSNDNSVVQLRANLMNVDEVIFNSEMTVFQPGAKATFKIIVGEEQPVNMCVAFLDSIDYNILSETVPISGRNSIGFKLMESTFDDISELSGTIKAVTEQIFILAGIQNYRIEENNSERTHEFKPNQSFLSGLEQIFAYYNWKLVEMPNGELIAGTASFISNYLSNSYYSFDSGELFKRRTKRSSDATYTKVRVTGKDINGNDLNPVTVEVKNYTNWALPTNKTYHTTVNDGYTQSELQNYAEELAESLRYVGVGEDFTGSIKPQLLVGDVAGSLNEDGTMTILGIVTSVKHRFGKQGYFTDFSTDSGGIVIDSRSNIVTVTKNNLNGYNRKQTLKDLIQVASGGSSDSQVSREVIKVVTNTDATTLEGKTRAQILEEAAAQAKANHYTKDEIDIMFKNFSTGS